VNITERRRVGRSAVEVTPLGLGTAPLGDLFVHVPDEEATAIVQTAIENGVNLVDTAPYYGLGLSEHRVGHALRSLPDDSFVLATKVGRLLRPVPRGRRRADDLWLGGLAFDPIFDYGYDALLRSHEDSLQRLGLPAVDMVAIHDLDPVFAEAHLFEERLRELERGGARALSELRASGAVGAVGLGINSVGAIPRVLEVIDLDYAIVAMPYTLLDQQALDEELQLCLERGVSVIIGAVFASGVLASAEDSGTYGYQDPPSEIVDRVRRMRAVCERHGVALPAAALQFPLGHPAVAAVIPGAVSRDHIRANVGHFGADIPAALWEEMKTEGLIRADAPVPDAASPR
jgi:D-threo-aldose 1-dehydrogenase